MTETVKKCKIHERGAHTHECYTLLHEYQIQSALSHPHVNKSLSFRTCEYQNQQQCVLEMHSCEVDWFQFVQNEFPNLRARVLVEMFAQIADALCYLHAADLCHFDIKPENIAIDRLRNSRLIDFGYAQYLSKLSRDECLRIWSGRDLKYLSPETARLVALAHHGALDEQALQHISWKAQDVFAFGQTIYSCLFYAHPPSASAGDAFWNANSQTQQYLQLVRAQIGPANTALLQALIFAMVANDQAERPPMSQVREQLELIKDSFVK